LVIYRTGAFPILRLVGRRFSLFVLPCLLTLIVAGAESTAAPETRPEGLLVPGGGAALDHVAFAVDGAESSHGTDARMWRAETDGPQGPMQVSAAAAADAGGGDRFDAKQNRALGRAYLARMYRRYGSWADAVAAYNWGPGRMDIWISGGRSIDKFPPAVARYRTRVLFVSGLSAGAGGEAGFGSISDRLARLGMLRLRAQRQMVERRRRSLGPDAVELLYADIMRITDPAVR
jgi:hypothetical protein